MREARKALVFALILYVIGFGTGWAAHASPGAYANRLAQHAAAASVADNCVVLRSIDLCGYRVPMIARSVSIGARVGGHGNGRWFDFIGRTTHTGFVCQGFMVRSHRRHRWIADQAVECYADDDPTWYRDGDLIIRVPR